MKSKILAALAIAGGTLLVPGAVAKAGAADFSPAPGAYAVDTGALTLTGPATGISGVDQGGVAVFSFDNVNIPSGVTITVKGARPFKLVAAGALTLAGTIDGDGGSATDFQASANAGGPGGGAGGAAGSAGGGAGGGDNSADTNNGGGGGGFGGAGAPGGMLVGHPDLGAGGALYGDLNTLMQGGSGGASGSGSTGGGGGGGVIALVGSTVTIPVGGVVFADGGGGASGNLASSGGGSGGGIVIRGNTVEVNGVLVARGGAGGAGGCCGDGGGGGGGRIAYQFRTLLASGTALVSGGPSGTRTSSGCCSHGALSTKANGDTGVVTKVEAPKAVTGPATAVSATGATLNGTVNPSLHPTNYYFEYGTTGSYGSRAPAGSGLVSSDGGDHVVSQALGGLSPNTTYHYRVVAVDALGFTIPGADIGFTTSSAPPPPAGTGSAKKVPAKKCKKKFKKKHGKCVKKKKPKKHGKHKKPPARNAPGRIG